MSAQFDLFKERDRYIRRITNKIKNKKVRQQVYEELCDHIDDSIYRLSLNGIPEEDAFYKTLKDFGDETKLEEMLAYSDKRRLPVFLKYVMLILLLACVAVSYFYIDNSSLQSYMLLFFNLFLFFIIVCVALMMKNIINSFFVRFKSYKKLKSYCVRNNISFKPVSCCFSSLLKPSDKVSLIVETTDNRYIIYFFPTIRKNRTLRILDSGLYSFSDNVGYANLFTQVNKHLPSSGTMFLPKGSKYLPFWHSEFAEVLKEFHLFPEINYNEFEKNDKKNIRVLLLNPVPYKVVGIINCIENELKDDSVLNEMRIWSMNGFLSFLRGEKIKGENC